MPAPFPMLSLWMPKRSPKLEEIESSGSSSTLLSLPKNAGPLKPDQKRIEPLLKAAGPANSCVSVRTLVKVLLVLPAVRPDVSIEPLPVMTTSAPTCSTLSSIEASAADAVASRRTPAPSTQAAVPFLQLGMGFGISVGPVLEEGDILGLWLDC